MRAELAELRGRLGAPGASERAADEVAAILGGSRAAMKLLAFALRY